MVERSFIQYSRAWYSSTLKFNSEIFRDDLIIGIATDDNYSEFRIVFEQLDGEVVPRLSMFSEAWELFFTECQDLINFMKNSREYVTINEVVEKLLEFGFIDKTPVDYDYD